MVTQHRRGEETEHGEQSDESVVGKHQIQKEEKGDEAA